VVAGRTTAVPARDKDISGCTSTTCPAPARNGLGSSSRVPARPCGPRLKTSQRLGRDGLAPHWSCREPRSGQMTKVVLEARCGAGKSVFLGTS
jgi:hypothetical protein